MHQRRRQWGKVVSVAALLVPLAVTTEGSANVGSVEVTIPLPPDALGGGRQSDLYCGMLASTTATVETGIHKPLLPSPKDPPNVDTTPRMIAKAKAETSGGREAEPSVPIRLRFQRDTVEVSFGTTQAGVVTKWFDHPYQIVQQDTTSLIAMSPGLSGEIRMNSIALNFITGVMVTTQIQSKTGAPPLAFSSVYACARSMPDYWPRR